MKHAFEVTQHYRHFSTRARDDERPGRAERDACDAFVAFVARERERRARGATAANDGDDVWDFNAPSRSRALRTGDG